MPRLLALLIAGFLLVLPGLGQENPGAIQASAAAPTQGPDLAALEARLATALSRARAATIGIRMREGTGSGVIVSPDGWVLTAAHLYDRAGARLKAVLADGSGAELRTHGRMVRDDFGLLRLQGEGPFPYVDMGISAELDEGQTLFALGHPGGVDPRRPAPLRLGQLTRKGRTFLRSSCIIDRGDSGGPLFDLEGRVVGIHSRIGRDFNQNLHVPVDRYRADWKRLRDGVSWGEVNFPDGAVMGIRGDAGPGGTRIERVFEDLPAAAAGLRVGDVIIAIDEESIDHMGDLKRYVARKSPGDVIRVRLERDGDELEREVTLGRSPNAPARSGAGEMPVLGDAEQDEENRAEAAPRATFDREAIAVALELDASALSRSVVRFEVHGRDRVLGTAVAPDLVATKASELPEDAAIEVELTDGRHLPIGEITRFGTHDLAFVRVPEADLTPVRFAREELPPGRLLVHVGEGELLVGASSVVTREVPGHRGGYLGVRLSDGREGALVASVMEGTPAARAGLEADDVITAIDGHAVDGRVALVGHLRKMPEGRDIRLEVRRGEEALEIPLTLGLRPEMRAERATERQGRGRFNGRRRPNLSGPLSTRRDAFPRVFEHDIPVHPRDCGAPLMDRDGRVVGLSIARATRHGTLALPAALVREYAARLK